MIKITNLKKDYGQTRALDDVSFEAKPGEVLGLLGPNGAGKTTLMRIVTGFLKQTGGSVMIDNLNIDTHSETIQSRIGYLPENTPLIPDLNVNEHLEFAAMTHGINGIEKEKAINNAIKICGLGDYRFFGITELSKGYRQRVGLAQALIHDPKILILDEPTTGLDPNQIVDIRNLIKSFGKEKLVILSTHIMQEVDALCDRVVVINKGKIVADDTPENIKEVKDSDKNFFYIHLSAKGPHTKIIKLLKAIDGVTSVKKTDSEEENIADYLIVSTKDVRSEINKNIIKADYEVLEISFEKQTMESAFHKLTEK